jgi:hypothetical protein
MLCPMRTERIVTPPATMRMNCDEARGAVAVAAYSSAVLLLLVISIAVLLQQHCQQ